MKIPKLGPSMSWDEVAEAYKELFGGRPMIMSMDTVFDRVAKSNGYHVNKKEGTIHKIL